MENKKKTKWTCYRQANPLLWRSGREKEMSWRYIRIDCVLLLCDCASPENSDYLYGDCNWTAMLYHTRIITCKYFVLLYCFWKVHFYGKNSCWKTYNFFWTFFQSEINLFYYMCHLLILRFEIFLNSVTESHGITLCTVCEAIFLDVCYFQDQ